MMARTAKNRQCSVLRTRVGSDGEWARTWRGRSPARTPDPAIGYSTPPENTVEPRRILARYLADIHPRLAWSDLRRGRRRGARWRCRISAGITQWALPRVDVDRVIALPALVSGEPLLGIAERHGR